MRISPFKTRRVILIQIARRYLLNLKSIMWDSSFYLSCTGTIYGHPQILCYGLNFCPWVVSGLKIGVMCKYIEVDINSTLYGYDADCTKLH